MCIRDSGMAHDPEKYYDNLSACSLCISCSDVCPVKVDLAEDVYKRQSIFLALCAELGTFLTVPIAVSYTHLLYG